MALHLLSAILEFHLLGKEKSTNSCLTRSQLLAFSAKSRNYGSEVLGKFGVKKNFMLFNYPSAEANSPTNYD